MDKVSLIISAVLQIVCGLILIGIAVYCLITEGLSSVRAYIFLAVGIVCIAIFVRQIIKLVKMKKDNNDGSASNGKN